jgi:hypothetical protein
LIVKCRLPKDGWPTINAMIGVIRSAMNALTSDANSLPYPSWAVGRIKRSRPRAAPLLIPFGDVARERDRPLGSAELGRQVVEAVGGARGKRHAIAGLRGSASGGGPDAGGRAGDEGRRDRP